jgi:hypothetical protein
MAERNGHLMADDQPADDAAEPGATRWRRFVAVVRSVVDLDPATLESATRELGTSRWWLAPVAWAAGTLVLLLRGVKLLVLNWRLSLVQLLPAVWIWLATWDLKSHLLHGREFHSLAWPLLVVLGVGVVVLTVAAYACNTIFALAIDGPPPPLVGPAARRAWAYRRTVLAWGLPVGMLLVVAAGVIPLTGRLWLFSLVLSATIALMLVTFVAMPARILGVAKLKATPTERIGGALAGGAVSAVAMGPGFVLDRLGLILLSVSGAQVLGFALLSLGATLYAAGMTSVKAVKLSMRLTSPEQGTASDRP